MVVAPEIEEPTFDMRAVGDVINAALEKQGFCGCKFIIIVTNDGGDHKSIASNLIESTDAISLLIEAASVMEMADFEDEEPVGHA